jgi:hypothetical protein
MNTNHVLTPHFARYGGGCPYLFVWNGQQFVKDNNILPASEIGNGTVVSDYYKIEQPLVPLVSGKASICTLQIREFEDEIDYIDQVKLIAVDHQQDTHVAVTPEGEIVTFWNPTSPLSCTDDHDISRLDEVGTMNGNIDDPSTYFQGNNGDWLILNFGRITSPYAKLILRDDQKCTNEVCIDVQIQDPTGGWRTITVLHPREFWSMEAINLVGLVPENDDLVVRLLWTAPHRLDYVGLDTSSEADTKITSALPIVAVHSDLGNVRHMLVYDDERYVRLANGQQLTLAFKLPSQAQNTCRDYIFYVKGYYYNITP